MAIGFIGCGKMSGALLRAWLDAGVADPGSVWIYDPGDPEIHGCRRVGAAQEVVDAAELVVLGVKPQYLAAALDGLRFTPEHIVVSLLAGTPAAEVRRRVAPARVVRVMPNILVSVGGGAALVLAHPEEAVTARVQGLLTSVAHTEIVHDERLFHAGTALVGSAPAALFVAIEALADGAVAAGMPRDQALRMAASVVAGSGLLVLADERHPAALKDSVASPGGTTIQALRALEAGGFRAALIEAMLAAARRSEELEKQ